MGWPGHLALNYTQHHDPHVRTVLHDRHSGPLRVLQSLYPEAPTVCHNVLVHPPGGVVGGDTLRIDADLAPGSHALITTPGATRFYRTAGELAEQSLTARIDDGARLEWLPLETIVHRSALAHNHMRFELAPTAEMMGWDLLALGLPASGEAFDHGRYSQQIELPGVWLERAVIDGSDQHLLDSPVGWAGHRLLATLWFASGTPLPPARRDALLDAGREITGAHPLSATAGLTAVHPQVVVLRVLAPRVEHAMALLKSVWAVWRQEAWGLAPCAPRIWAL